MPEPEANITITNLTFQRYYRLVQRVVSRYFKDPDEIEDMTQEVWLRIIEQQHTYNPERGSMATWISDVARSVCVNHLEARSSKKRSGDSESYSENDYPDEETEAPNRITDIPSLSSSPEEILRAEQFAEEILRGLPGHVEIITELYYSGHSIQEISRTVKISEDAICGYLDEIEDRVLSYLKE